MELIPTSSLPESSPRTHSLKGDIVRAWLAVLFGFVASVMLQPFLEPSIAALYLVQLLIPIALVLVLIVHRNPTRSVAVARSLGASVAWLGWLFVAGNLLLLLSIMGALFVLVFFPLSIAILVVIGTVVADRLWLITQKNKPHLKGPEV